MSSERSRIELLRAALGGAARPGVVLGIGDDAAILEAGAEPLVWTVDVAVEGVHFRRDLLSLGDLGYRATMAAASDLAAMGARPLGLLAALVLPAWVTDDDLAKIAAGQKEAADELGSAVVGGNLARGGELSITTTALGAAARPLRRDGGRPGDELWLAGPVGLAAAGLASLISDPTGPRSVTAEAAVHAWRRPVARIARGRAAAVVARAAIDVSDGLAQDVAHLARGSHTRAILWVESLLSTELVSVAAELGRQPLELALRGGEDYALVIALPPGARVEGFTRIGALAQPDGASGVWLRQADGTTAPVDDAGFDHFETVD